MNQIETKNYGIDTIIKDRQTDYFCALHQLPDEFATKKRHLVKYETLFQPSHAKYVHHWVLNECDLSFETEYFKNYTFPAAGTCAGMAGQTKEWEVIQRYCTKSTLAWATGGDIEQYIPEHLGYPLGGPDQSKFFFIQWHIENSDLDQNVREDASIRMFFTENYRQTEFGVMEIGALFNEASLAVPPKAKSLTLEYMCQKNQMNAIRGSNSELTIFAQFPHTHNAGVSFYSKIVRNGTEVEYVANNEYYDNAYQYINYLQNPVKIKENDEFLLSCVYNSEYSDKFILGGLGTNDEMCLNFVWYYPRSPVNSRCFSTISDKLWYNFFDNLNRTGQINWYYDSDRTFYQDSYKRIEESNLVNDPTKLEKMFDDFFKNAQRITFQDTTGVEVNSPINVQRIAKDACTDTASTTAVPATTSSFLNSSTKNKSIVGLLMLSILSAILM